MSAEARAGGVLPQGTLIWDQVDAVDPMIEQIDWLGLVTQSWPVGALARLGLADSQSWPLVVSSANKTAAAAVPPGWAVASARWFQAVPSGPGPGESTWFRP